MPPRLPTTLALRPLQRAFSTTPVPKKVAPESPKFIEIPQPPRTTPLWKPITKGKLPPPKTIFPSSGPDKTSAEYLALATPEPTKARAAPPHKPQDAAYIEWKAKMAKRRRQNLREGIIELAEKKRTFDSKRATVLEKRAAHRQALLDRKEREDVRLTLPSVLSTLKSPERFLDPNRDLRLRRAKVKLAKQVEKKLEARREQLHNLYLNASSFLLTERHLDAAIEAEFDQPSLDKTLPLTVTEMLAQRARGPMAANFGSMSARESELIMEAAAALTGGKLPRGIDRSDPMNHGRFDR